MKIEMIRNNPERKEEAAKWFSQKWGIPYDAYLESMNDCLKNENAIPQWYIMTSDDEIIGGLGVIANDFHDRLDFTPNVCAVFVESDYRKRGIAGQLLNCVCEDMRRYGINVLYLLTDHIGFYEKYGWTFYCKLNDDENDPTRVYRHICE